MNRHRKRKLAVSSGAILLAAAALLGVLLHFSDASWSRKYRHEETREAGNQAFMEEGLVEWNGEKYRKKSALTTILLAGIDRNAEEAATPGTSYRNGGQADFLLLLAIDHGEKKIHQLQIDRDTMTEVMILGVYGNETGTRELQICLAHSFGARDEDQAKYTVRAVRTLLDGIDIDGYYMVDYSAVPLLTDTLDGVPVTIPEDMTSVNPEWFQGHTVTLRGAEAETFVRTRKTIGGGTNAERMKRQAVYMRAAIGRMHQQLSQQEDFASRLFSALRRIAETNLTDQRLAEEMNAAKNYETLPVEYLPGEYKLAENGFIEFYPEEGSAKAWIMEHLYRLR